MVVQPGGESRERGGRRILKDRLLHITSSARPTTSVRHLTRKASPFPPRDFGHFPRLFCHWVLPFSPRKRFLDRFFDAAYGSLYQALGRVGRGVFDVFLDPAANASEVGGNAGALDIVSRMKFAVW